MLVVGFAACGGDSDDPESTTFTVRIEAASQAYDVAKSGAFNTPVGADAPGPALPGGVYEFTFTAAPGSRVSFATMMVQSNDLFYAPAPEGIALYGDDGQPISGDITEWIMLWDAGTEVDQEPGLGADQAPRQTGADTGAADPNDTVRLATDDFDNLPDIDEVVRVTVTPGADMSFTISIENVSDATTLETSDGATHPVPLAPGVFAVHSDGMPLFAPDWPAEAGLEALAEDGNAAILADEVTAVTGLTIPLSPGVWAVHLDDDALFSAGVADRGDGLEALAEDGDPSLLSEAIAGAVAASGAFNTPEGASAPGPIGPGAAYVFEVEAMPGDMLSFATMFVPSNDLFLAPDGSGIELFDTNDAPISGDVTASVLLWDAGTEVNQEPGVGGDQVAFQSAPDTGADEDGAVREVEDGFSYPEVSDIVTVTVTAQQ